MTDTPVPVRNSRAEFRARITGRPRLGPNGVRHLGFNLPVEMAAEFLAETDRRDLPYAVVVRELIRDFLDKQRATAAVQQEAA